MNSTKQPQYIAKKVFDIQSKSIANLSNQLTTDFDKSIDSILSSSGKLIISGMGKSGIIGKKIAATLASTGTPSFFLHPGEAYHGDLGMIEKEDIVLLLSNSGETDEVLKLIPFLNQQKNTTISMTGNPDSTLAKNCNFHLNISVEKEACPLQLAPTSSTTASLVMGDALAVALMEARNFSDKDFAIFHPGGSLGRRLLTRVKNVMGTSNLPTCKENANIKDVIHIITSGRSGLAVITKDKNIKGVISDGDVRRAMECSEESFFSLNASDIMSSEPKTIHKNASLTEAQEIMSQNKINSLLVVNNLDELAGIIQMYNIGL